MKFWIAFTVLTVLTGDSAIAQKTQEDELLLLRKTVIYLNDYALASCRASRDSLIAYTIVQSVIAETYAARIDSLSKAIEKQKSDFEAKLAKFQAEHESKDREVFLFRILTGALILLLIISSF
jgi:cupin superfamily acireductone dioxygenase involved in methionine salvage